MGRRDRLGRRPLGGGHLDSFERAGEQVGDLGEGDGAGGATVDFLLKYLEHGGAVIDEVLKGKLKLAGASSFRRVASIPGRF